MKFLSQINVNTEYTLPFVDGTNGQVLTTDGNGAVYWGSVSAGVTNLNALTDVELTSPTSGQILRYELPPGGQIPIWRNVTPNYLTPNSSINALGDVTITSAVPGQILQFNGTYWINTTLSTVEYVSKVQHTVKAGVAISKGQAVYITTSDGTNMIAGLASNAAEATSSKVIGLAAANAAVNDQIFVVTEGLIAGLDTSTATAGDPVWLGTNGNLIFGLANKPVAPAHLVYIGVVTRVQSNNGEIFVNVQNGFELNEIHDALIVSPTAGQLLRRDSDNLWKNWSPNFLTAEADTLNSVTGRGATTTNAITVGGLTVDTSTLVVDATNNRVGIGTASPLTTLDVVGHTYIRGGLLYVDTIAGYSAGKISLNGSTNLIVPSGNVGVGTTTPQKFLDVNGSGIVASFGGTFSPGSFAGIHFGYSESNLNNDSYKKSAIVFERTDNHGQGGNASGKIHFLLNNIAGGSATSLAHSVMVIDTNSTATQGSARVGIGTTSPNSTLDVNGAANATSFSSTALFIANADTSGGQIPDQGDPANKIYSFRWMGNEQGYIDTDAKITFAGFKTPTGTASQFLKANGTVDSNVYITSAALSGYATQTWVNANFYEQGIIDDFFYGNEPILGYNKTNWDAAYGWGNHANAGYATTSYVTTAIANLVDSAPSTLDTLNELAAALGDDPNFATTVTNSIATKVPQTRTLTINGTAFDLSADRSWTISTADGYISDVRLTESTLEFTGEGSAFNGSVDLSTLPFQPAGSYLTAEADTLATVVARGNSTTGTINVGGLNVVSGGTAQVSYFGSTANTEYADIALKTNDGQGEIFRTGTSYSFWGGVKSLNIYNSNGPIALHPNGQSNVLFLSNSAYVGIGTTTPQVKLDVNGHVGIVGSNYLYFGHNTSNIGAWTTRQYSNGSTHKLNAVQFIFNDEGYGSYEHMRLTYTGLNLNGKQTIDSTDSWLRLNQSGDYASGVYTPGILRNDGQFINYGGIYGYANIQARKAQTAGNYTTAALWTESYDNTTTGIAFHISGNVGKFLEMRTDGVLYWNGDTVLHSGNIGSYAWNSANDGSGSGLDADLLDGQQGSYYQPASTAITTSNIASQSVSYATSSGNSVSTDQTNFTELFIENAPVATKEYVTSQGYITGYTETDTLATVTGRGATTSTTLTLARVVTTGLYGPSTAGNIPIWQYDAANTGYGIIYAEGTPDLLRIDVSGQALTGTPDFLIGPDYAQVNGNNVWHAGNDGSGSGLDADLFDGVDSSRFVYGNSGTRRGTNLISNWNQTDYPDVAFLSSENGGTNAPSSDYSYGMQYSFHRSGAAYRTQFVTSLYSDLDIWVRNSRDSDVWTSWKKLIHSANIASQSVAYATSSGNSVSTDQTNFSELFIDNAPVATKEYVTSQGYLTSLPSHNHDDRYYTESESDSRFVNTAGDTMTGELTLKYTTDDSSDYNGLFFAPYSDAAGLNDYIIKAASDRGVFGRKSFGWHVHSESAFGVYSNGWVKLFGVEGGTGNTQVFGNLTVNGTITESSSIRFKENITPLGQALDKVNQLEAVSYNKIGADDREIGLIAEEVAELFPEVVTYNEEGQPQGIQYQRLSVILLKAVQELTERVNKLENK